jgi:carnitine 3-dehydrogenase
MARPLPGEVTRVAVVGTGLIGAGWAAFFLSRGLDVAATDPAPGAEERLRREGEAVWPLLARAGLAATVSTSRLSFSPDLAATVAGAQFVQENVPDDDELKTNVITEIDGHVDPEVVIASSTSGILPTVFQARCRHPERVLVGHPFNPAHLIPLVEVVAGERTSAEAVDWTITSYERVGKQISDELTRDLDEQTRDQARGHSLEEWERLRDEFLVRVLEVKREVFGE